VIANNEKYHFLNKVRRPEENAGVGLAGEINSNLTFA
jgi:hypothetical protein